MASNPVNRKLVISKVKPSTKYNSVIIVDDQELDNWITQKILEAVNFSENIHVYTSGEAAIEYLQGLNINSQVSASLAPDFIFVNTRMPQMSGIEFVKKMQELPEAIRNHTKIVLMSPVPNPKEEAQVKSLKGVYKYLPKPLSIEALETL
ncbi:MAG: response regulator [Bacteroidia bacterium]|nr:response regulator [Bacteroidia bacterium]MDW8158716.1 response regulator [Bacteroidia bacterium]